MFSPTYRLILWLYFVLACAGGSHLIGADELRQEQRFSEAAPNEGFGEATAISGDWAVIAAPWSSGNRGRVQVYQRQAGVWRAGQVILSPMPQDQSLFGKKLALDGDWLAISQESSNVSDSARGSVHVYHRSVDRWNLVQTLRGTQAGADFYRFGDGLDLAGGMLAVTDDVTRGFERFCSVRIYRLRAASWELEQTLVNVTTRVNQAAVLAMKLHGDVLALGNPWRLGKDGWNVGEVQIFRCQSGAAGRWKHEQTLLADVKSGAQRFGESVGFTAAGELLATSSRGLWSSSLSGKSWSQPAVVVVKGREPSLTNAGTSDIHISGSVAVVILDGLCLLRRSESGWQLMRKLPVDVQVPPLAVSADSVLFRSQWGNWIPESASFLSLAEIEVHLGSRTSLVPGYGQEDEEVKPGSQMRWRPWIDGASLPLRVGNAGPSLLPFPTAQLSGTDAAHFEIVSQAAAPSLLAAGAEAAFELRPRATLPQSGQMLTVTFSTGGTVPEYSFQVAWDSDFPQSFAAPQVSLPPAVIHAKGQRLIITPRLDGGQSMTYRWSREGRTLPGQTRASLDLAALRPEDAGYYQLEVKSGTHTIFSNQCELVVFEPQSGVIPMRDDQSARLTAKLWGRAKIVWQDTQTYRDLAHPYIFGVNSPTLTVMSGRWISFDQEELSAVAEVLDSSNRSAVSTVVARYTLRRVGPAPRILVAYPEAYWGYRKIHEVGDSLSGDAAIYAENALDLDGLNLAFPGSTLEATGLPPGITLDSTQGTLSGTFTKAGEYRVTWHLTDFLGRKAAPFVSLIRVGQLPLAAPAEPGVYAGLVTGSAELPAYKLGGYLELQMQQTGSFSGLLRMNAQTRRFAGRMKALSSSYYECELPLTPLSGTKKLRLILSSEPSLTPLGVQVIATLADDRTETWDCGLYFRAQGAKLVTPDIVGRYNGLLESDLIDGDVFPPRGSSLMSLQVSPGSLAVAAGTLADGTGYTCACPLTMMDGITLKMPFYLHAAAQGSTLSGELTLDAGGTLTFGADLQWRQIAKPGARLYPAGFHLSLRGGGALYVMPPAGYTLLANATDAPGNAIILPDPLHDGFEATYFRLTTDHRALLPKSAPGRDRVTRLDFYAPTGFFTGEIILEPTNGEGGRRVPGGKVGFRGLMLPYLGVGGGYYHRPSILLNEGSFISKGIAIWRGQ